MTVVNATFEGVNGFSDDSVVLFRSPRLRGSGDSEVIVTRKSIRVKPEDGEISVDLDPGLVEVSISGGSYLISVPTSGPVNLWDLIAAAIPFPEGTPSEAVGAAVSAHMKLYPGEVALSAVGSAVDELVPPAVETEVQTVTPGIVTTYTSGLEVGVADAGGGNQQITLGGVPAGSPFPSVGDLEFQFPSEERFVASTGSDSNTGRTWGKPFATIAAALADLPAGGGRIYLGGGGLSEEGLAVADGDAVRIEAIGLNKTTVTGSGGTFLTKTGSGKLHISGMDFTGFADVLKFDGSDVDIELFDNESRSNTGSFITHSAQTNTIKRFVARDNYIHDHVGAGKICAFRLNVNYLDNVLIESNWIEDLTSSGDYSAGVYVGNTNVAQDSSDMRAIRVEGNIIRRITAEGECHSIIVAGEDATVINNLCDTTTPTSDADCEGIYVKGVRARVAGNTLVDCGAEGANTSGAGFAIAVKGQPRDGDGTQPGGWGQRIEANHIYESRSVGAGGVLVDCEDALLFGNYIDGCDGNPIRITPAAKKRVSVVNNTCVNGRAQSIILVRNYAEHLDFIGNALSGASHATETHGIYLLAQTDASSLMTLVTFANNRVYGLVSAANPSPTNQIGFRVRATAGTISNITFNGNYVDGTHFSVCDASGSGVLDGNTFLYMNNEMSSGTAFTYPVGARVIDVDSKLGTGVTIARNFAGAEDTLKVANPSTDSAARTRLALSIGGTVRGVLYLNPSSGFIIDSPSNNNITFTTGGEVRANTDFKFTAIGDGPIVRSPDGSYWRLSVDNSGVVSATSA